MGDEKNNLNTNYLKIGWISLILTVLGIVGLVVFASILPIITSFFAIIGNIGISLGMIYFIDKYVLHNIDTLQEIKNGNISYAIFILAISLIIAYSISGS